MSIISEETDWWLQPGRRKFTVGINDNIAYHVKAIWCNVLKRSTEGSKISLRYCDYDHLSHILAIN